MIKVEKNDETGQQEEAGVRLGNGSAKHGLHRVCSSTMVMLWTCACLSLGLIKFVLNWEFRSAESHLNQENSGATSTQLFDAPGDASKDRREWHTGDTGYAAASFNVVKIWFD